MNAWFQQNRFLGAFFVLFALGTIGSLLFLVKSRSAFHDARLQFDANAAELNQLQRHSPFPNEANLRKMKAQADDYGAQLEKLKGELKTHVLPVAAMAPNEFQSRLRQASASVAEKARANRVKLPDNFYFGFEEFAAALPDTAAAPLLGQQLAQAELLANILLDARVEAVTSFRRVPNTEQRPGAEASPTPSPTPRRAPGAAPPGPSFIERTAIETAFVSSPGAARRILNQTATVSEQFYIVRALHVLNEKDKGPPRGDGTGAAATVPAAAGAIPASALQFIVGHERIQTSARIEMVRFNF